MNLLELIEFVRNHEKELGLFNLPTGDDVADELAAFFDTQNVRVRTYVTASRHPEVAVLSDTDCVLERVSVDRLRDLVSGAATGVTGVGIADVAYEEILGPLKETTFTSHDTEQMLYASREIEDRARRVGEGTVHAGFQRLSLLAEQAAIYTDLANQGLTVHTYGEPDVEPPAVGDATVHSIDADEIATTWFVVFDGDWDDAQKSALLAEERAPDSFYGAWTYDPAIVDRLCSHLETVYCEPDGRHLESGR